ncbi:DUF4010 domain-containing protein [Thiomicrorhabdus sp. Milos-T2]|uniref:MgtC/SapB family protein n=1 Tax=Thiomicrorhabdus sp. Milos-T2 TaxID=90814 RepID=UPI00068933CE|nr:DUF4010 domain-containing protein [Thiomicrorhabdus sp. Milos-T2]
MIALQHELWAQLILILLFSFLTGSELRGYQNKFHADTQELSLGTVRTLTLTGLMASVFFLVNEWLYLLGFAALAVLFSLLYWQRLKLQSGSLLTFLVWALTYSYAPLVMMQPLWLASGVFVVIVLLLNSKQVLNDWEQKVSNEELNTLAKLVLLSVVILPLLPQENINQWLPVSPFKIWLAVVVVSSVSYLGYVSQKFFVKDQGLMVTGILGGLYSSTATTVVLAKKSIEYPRLSYKMTAAIISATGLMYVRLWVIVALFMWSVALELLPIMLGLSVLAFGLSFIYIQVEKRNGEHKHVDSSAAQNPLELKVAFIFAGLFVLMAVVTQFVMSQYGDTGVRYLSALVGFTDIDPFVLSILNGQYEAQNTVIAGAILIAAGSNNLLKAIYAIVLGEPKAGRYSAFWLVLLGLISITIGWQL